ncbi:hypothetical protein KY331_04200 [Candidatus Woesearchaeota archaeon]|nr:hypothetical protein [Candidatus Woesearchaeota archaeon]
MIDPKKELFKWGPIDGRPIYVDPFVRAFVSYPGFIDGSWPDALGFFKDDKIVFILNDENLRDSGEKLFKKYVLDEKEVKKGRDGFLKACKKVKEYEIKVNEGLSKLSDSELKDLFVKWDKAHIDFWHWGFLPELSNWGGERLLKKKILEFNKLNFIEIFEALSAPEDLSFFQTEELELMKIKLSGELERLKEHQKKYYWIRNSYGFTKVLDVDFLRKKFLKKMLRRKLKRLIIMLIMLKRRKKL